jgi:hypothetical protein
LNASIGLFVPSGGNLELRERSGLKSNQGKSAQLSVAERTAGFERSVALPDTLGGVPREAIFTGCVT